MKRHIVITKLFKFGGSNTHLKMLFKYFGDENSVLVLENKNELSYLNNVGDPVRTKIKIMPRLHRYANLSYPSVLSNIKELLLISRSIVNIFILSAVNGFADVTINAVEPEKHLYLMLIPFIRVNYILHSTPSGRHSTFSKLICDFALSRRKQIITVSNNNRRLIINEWNILEKKNAFVKVVYNCVTDLPPQELTDVNTSNYIITLGHVIGYKNPFLWLEVAKSVTDLHKDIHFIWFGDGPLIEPARLALNGAENITFAGVTDDPGDYLRRSIIYYQPSLEETQGIAVLEGMSFSLPCIVSNVGGLPEIIKDSYNGILVPPTVEKDHVDAILRLINNPELRATYGRNAYKTCVNEFTYDMFKEKMNNIYPS